MPNPFVRRSLLVLPLLTALSLSCASPAELSRRSEHALAAGDDARAWKWAERAMRASATLPRARNAMSAAAARAVPDWEQRVRTLAATDTLAAARLSLAFGKVRAQLDAWNIAAPVDTAYLTDERLIRRSAAQTLYRRGNVALHDRRPRDALRDFTAVNEIVPGYRRVDERIEHAYQLSIVRIAILPFQDETGVPGLAVDAADEMRLRVSTAMPEKRYPFVRFLSREEISARLASNASLGRDEAIRLGRQIGAQRVVWGRIHGLSTETRTDTRHDRVFRKITDHDTAVVHTRFEEVPFETIERERTVHVSWSFEVIETDEEQALGKREGTEHLTARTVWTSFDAPGNCDDYSFAPPEWKRQRADDWRNAESEWKQRYGDWSVPHLLQARRGAREHPGYRREDRDRFRDVSRPLLMDDLPPPADLAFVALHAVDDQVWDVLKALEREPKPRP